MAQTEKYSRQRALIADALQNRCDHPSADRLYRELRQVLPTISLGTVYRNLAFLEERGRVLRLKSTDGRDHFDGTVSPHHHFCCSSCGEISDVDLPADPSLDRLVEKQTGFQVTAHSLMFYGICGSCRGIE